jgi:hypothetical protein
VLYLREEVGERVTTHRPLTWRRILRELARGALWTFSVLLGLLCAVQSAYHLLFATRYAVWWLGLFTAGTVFGIVLARHRRASRPLILLACQLALLIGLVSYLSRGPARAELPAEGARFIEALDVYRREHGRYPTALAEAGCAPRWNAYGGWQYEPRSDGQSWSLRVGSYSEDGFVLERSTGDASWSWDD